MKTYLTQMKARLEVLVVIFPELPKLQEELRKVSAQLG